MKRKILGIWSNVFSVSQATSWSCCQPATLTQCYLLEKERTQNHGAEAVFVIFLHPVLHAVGSRALSESVFIFNGLWLFFSNNSMVRISRASTHRPLCVPIFQFFKERLPTHPLIVWYREREIRRALFLSLKSTLPP